jgi:drug/metabolite transporter (DMT)-like permease
LKRKVFEYHLLLHLVVLIYGFTGILGKLITLQSTVLVVYRMAIAVFTISVYFAIRKQSIRMGMMQIAKNSLIGIMVGTHWILFFESIKQSTVAITMVCLATAPFFVSFIEPIVFRRALRVYESALGILAVLALGLIFRVEPGYETGILLGISASLAAAVFTVVNGRFMQQGSDASLVAFYQLLSGLISVSVYSLCTTPLNAGAWSLYGLDWFYVSVLGSVCTAFAYIAAIKVMKVLSPFTTMLTINLEPIYAIVMALAIFGESEIMSIGFYVGALVILATIVGNVMIKRRLSPETGLLPSQTEGI